MVEFSAEVTVGASPEALWRVMSDPAREPEWMRAVTEAVFLGGATGYEVGARMRRGGRFLWFDLSWESVVAAYEPARLAVFRHEGGALRGESRWELRPTEQGCRVTLASTGPAPGPLKWAPALAAAGGRMGLRGDLARLKALVERGAGIAG